MRESDHERQVGEESFRVVLPQFHVGVIKEAFEDCTRDVGRLVAWPMSAAALLGGLEMLRYTGSKEKGNEGKDHFFAKLLVEEKHAEHDSDGDKTQNGHGPFDELQDLAELPDVGGELVD